MARRSRVEVSQYAVALIFAPGSMKSTRRMPFLSQIFLTEIQVLNFFFLFWVIAYGAIEVTVAWIQECVDKRMFHLQSQSSPETHLLSVRSV